MQRLKWNPDVECPRLARSFEVVNFDLAARSGITLKLTGGRSATASGRSTSAWFLHLQRRTSTKLSTILSAQVSRPVIPSCCTQCTHCCERPEGLSVDSTYVLRMSGMPRPCNWYCCPLGRVDHVWDSFQKVSESYSRKLSEIWQGPSLSSLSTIVSWSQA